MAVLIYYDALFVLSLTFAAIYIYIWHKHFNSSFTIIFTLIPVSCLGYVMYASSTNLESSITS